MRRVLTMALATAATLAVATPASASLYYIANPSVTISAQGFGNVPRDLTISNPPRGTTESGCVSVNAGGTINIGSSGCVADSSLNNGGGGNSYTNLGGNEPPPLADNQKYGIPTVSQLGWASAADIGLLFNATEPSGNNITVHDITLKFYDNQGNLIYAIDNAVDQSFNPSQQGNGSAGFVFGVSSDEQAALDLAIFGQGFNYSQVYVALESTLTDASGGDESWVAFNLSNGHTAVPEPATWAMMLLGFGGIGIAMRRRRANSRLLQIA